MPSSDWSIVAAEVVAVVAGIAVLNGPLGLPRAVLPWVTFVVGVHFLGLVRGWKAPSLSWLGAGMALCGASGLVAAALGAPTAAIAAVAGVAPGALLLAGSSRHIRETGPGARPALPSAAILTVRGSPLHT